MKDFNKAIDEAKAAVMPFESWQEHFQMKSETGKMKKDWFLTKTSIKTKNQGVFRGFGEDLPLT